MLGQILVPTKHSPCFLCVELQALTAIYLNYSNELLCLNKGAFLKLHSFPVEEVNKVCFTSAGKGYDCLSQEGFIVGVKEHPSLVSLGLCSIISHSLLPILPHCFLLLFGIVFALGSCSFYINHVLVFFEKVAYPSFANTKSAPFQFRYLGCLASLFQAPSVLFTSCFLFAL